MASINCNSHSASTAHKARNQSVLSPVPHSKVSHWTTIHPRASIHGNIFITVKRDNLALARQTLYRGSVPNLLNRSQYSRITALQYYVQYRSAGVFVVVFWRDTNLIKQGTPLILADIVLVNPILLQLCRLFTFYD